MFKIYETPQDPDCEPPIIQLSDLRQTKRELSKEIDDREYDRKKNGIEYDTKEAISLLYDEVEFVTQLIKDQRNGKK